MGKGIKMGEKTRKGEREKSFFCQEKLFHIYRRGIPCACPAEERVGRRRGMKQRGIYFFSQTGMCCHRTLVFTNYVKMRFDSVRLLEGLVNNFDCYNRLFSKRFTCPSVKITPRLLSVCGSGFCSS